MTWDRAKAKAGLALRDRDLAMLTKLVDDFWSSLNEWEGNAYTDMLARLEHDGGQLTDAQREKVRETAERVGASIEYENLVSSGQAPRGREVELMVKDKPLRPPGRRKDDDS